VRFTRPAGGTFEIPDEWWRFADMNTFSLDGARCFPVDPARVDDLVPVVDIEPPERDPGVAPFKKAKMVPILMAFVSSNALPPIEVCRLGVAAPYRYRLYDGYHRFYASVAVGYPMVPIADVGDCQ
jgi:hypothetical protein